MIPKYYCLSTIQKLSSNLLIHSRYFESLVNGQAPTGLTPQEILDSFVELALSYDKLLQVVAGVSVAIGAGHDSDRQLFLGDFSDIVDFENLPSLDELESITKSM